MDPEPLRPSLVAGIAAGLVAIVSFWVFHTRYIADVPVVLLEGIVWALVAGSAAGWAYHHVAAHGGLAFDTRGGLLFGAALWLLLVPYELVGLVFGPFTHLTRPAELASVAPAGLLGVPFGALLGWAWTRRARPTVAMAVAILLTHFMFGGSMVYFGGRGVILVLFFWMLPTFLASGLVFARVRRALVARAASSTPSEVTP